MKTEIKRFKQGDKVILTKRGGRREVRTVLTADTLVNIREPRSRINYHFNQDGTAFGGSSESIAPATPETIAEVQEENRLHADRERSEARRVAADPRTALVSRFNGGWEPFDKLTLEQLNTIAGWLDAVRWRGSEQAKTSNTKTK